MTGTAVAFWTLVATLGAVYVGYPALLFALARLRGSGRHSSPIEAPLPTVTVLVPAHNEEAVIEAKVRNLLDLGYPAGRLEALIVSDGSTDRTCEIARGVLESVAPDVRSGIRILERPGRTGKTVALSESVPQARGEILFFTDANAMFHRDAVRKIVSHFSDPTVGLVCGRLRYVDGPAGEGLYWRYEDAIKRLEGELGRLLVANGSIYAIRRELFHAMPGAVADDFAVPLNVASEGYRLLYEPEAIAEERLPARVGEDFRAKARIVTRGLEAVWRYRREILRSGPMRVVQYLFHKILRWLAPVLLIALWVVSVRGGSDDPVIGAALVLQATFYVLALYGFLLAGRSSTPAPVRVPLHFCLVNAAALKGLFDFLLRRERSIWDKSETTRREDPIA